MAGFGLKPLKDKVSGLFGKARMIPTKSQYTVEHEKLDEFILSEMDRTSRRFHNVRTSSVEIERTDENGDTHVEAYEQAINLRDDLFLAHHVGTDDVRMMDAGEIRPSAMLNSEIMRHFTVHPDFLATRPMTRMDEVGSTLATMAAEQALVEELQTTLKDHAQDVQDAASDEEKIRQAQQQLEELRQQVRDAKANGVPIDPALIQAIKDMIAQREEAAQRLQQTAQKMGQAMGGQVAGAVAAAAANSKELCEVYVSLPGVGVGAGQKIKPEQAIELAYKWRNASNLKRIAELLGRLERDFRYKRSSRIVGGFDEVIGVEVGNDVRRLLPHEFANLHHPILRTKFKKDFAARQLLQYEMIGYAEAGKGPVIILIDASGSMSGVPNEWARAVALATTSIAQREKRAVYIIEFCTVVSGEWYFPKGGVDPEVATDFAMSFNGGGTDITSALRRAKEIFEQHPEFKSADILLITDGSDFLGQDDLELRDYFRGRGVRLQGVTIALDETPYTNEVCDDSVAVYDLTGSSDATDRIVTGLT